MAAHSDQWGTKAGHRIARRIDALASISETEGALTRVFLSRQHREAAELLMGWIQEAGLSARMDAIGNVIGRMEGETPGLPCLMLGSHYDTVRDAGKWDGPLGIITAIECAAEVSRKGLRLPFAIEVAAFSDEEGVRFTSTLLGSRAMAGTLDPHVLDASDSAGVIMRDAMRVFGLDPDGIGLAARQQGEILAYCELHIEQGPVLEAEGLPVGVVTAISGASRYSVELEGIAGHAGTVPMGLRRDALAAAAECICEVERICRDAAPPVVGTVGSLTAHPGAVNVIPGRVQFSLDIRSANDRDRQRVAAAILSAINLIATARELAARLTPVHENGTAPCAPWLKAQLAKAAAAEGYPVLELPSGAGHDGMAMISMTDIAMLFVRCRAGISHSPFEHVTPEDAAAGARVLLRFIENFRPKANDV